MGYIKEPEGVDFVINGKPLTEQQKKEITAFIKADKARNVKFENLAIKGKKRPLNTTK